MFALSQMNLRKIQLCFMEKFSNGNYTIYTIPHTAEVVQKFYSNIGELMKQVKFDDKRPIMERYDYELVEKGKCEMCIPTESIIYNSYLTTYN